MRSLHARLSVRGRGYHGLQQFCLVSSPHMHRSECSRACLTSLACVLHVLSSLHCSVPTSNGLRSENDSGCNIDARCWIHISGDLP